MEENKNNKKKKSVIDATVVLSFVVAIFAIVSLIAFGINEVSYAADPVVGATDLGGGFTLHSSSAATNPYYYDYNDTTAGRDTVVNYLWGDSEDVGLYCIEHGVNITNNTAYTKDGKLSDNPLMYILANGEKFVKDKGVTNEEAIYWIVQSAIWVHMHNLYGATDAGTHGLTDVDSILDASVIYKHTMSSTTGNFSNTQVSLGSDTAEPGTIVGQLVDEAEQHTASILSVNVSACDKLEDLNGDKRCLINVSSPLNNIKSYTVSLADSDLTGVFVSNGDSTPLNDHVFNGGESFYVYIPKSELPNKILFNLEIF